jgi:hypothetical protein
MRISRQDINKKIFLAGLLISICSFPVTHVSALGFNNIFDILRRII